MIFTPVAVLTAASSAPVPLTLAPAIIIVLIAALLAFWLFAPTATVASSLNAIGGAFQWLFAKIKGFFVFLVSAIKKLFAKKSTPLHSEEVHLDPISKIMDDLDGYIVIHPNTMTSESHLDNTLPVNSADFNTPKQK